MFKVKDILLIGIVSTLLFPSVLIMVLISSGAVHLSLGVDDPTLKSLSEYLERVQPEQESSDEKQTKLFEANKKLRTELDEKEKAIQKEMDRLEGLRLENNNIKKQLDTRKNDIEKMVNKNLELSDKRLEALARVYGAMKPVESAPILLSMNDQKVSQILGKISEVRSQGKILSALGAMDRERAANISRMLGWKKGGEK